MPLREAINVANLIEINCQRKTVLVFEGLSNNLESLMVTWQIWNIIDDFLPYLQNFDGLSSIYGYMEIKIAND